MSYSYSPLACPFPAAISPHAATIEAATIAWARHIGLIQGPADIQRLQQLQYGMLMARAYPHAALPALQLISDWNTWLFLLDDQCDEAGLGRSTPPCSTSYAADRPSRTARACGPCLI
jgi:hypothetical protein